jgi:hypothetical protein
MGKLNQKLHRVYERNKAEWILAADRLPMPFLRRLTPPLLLSTNSIWEKTEAKLLIVGQETLGWAFGPGEYYPWDSTPIRNFVDFLRNENSVSLMQGGYESFNFAQHQPENYRSPFWYTYRFIRETAASSLEWSVLWTNLFRFSIDGNSVFYDHPWDEINRVSTLNKSILRNEIHVLRPRAVIFLTGPNYDFELESCFHGLRHLPFGKHKLHQASRIEHDVLPEKSFRTYHPGYLYRGHWKILEEIVRHIR